MKQSTVLFFPFVVGFFLIRWDPVGVVAFQIQHQHQRHMLLSHVKTTTYLCMSSGNNKDETSTTSAVIYANDDDFDYDEGQGGVRLAEESALCLRGSVPSSGSAKPSEFVRYTKLTVWEDTSQKLEQMMKQQGVQIVSTSQGRELYKDPGEGSEQVIELAPLEAVRDLFVNLLQKQQQPSMDDYDDNQKYQVNLVGGDDLQVLEVLEALTELRQGLDNLAASLVTGSGNTKRKKTTSSIPLSFSSLTDSSFPLEQVSITLLMLPQDSAAARKKDSNSDNTEEATTQLNSLEKAIAAGQVFFADGTYYTLLEEDINPNLV